MYNTRGNTVQQRSGDFIKVSKISLKMRTTYGTSVDGDVIIKWMLICHKNSGGATLSATAFCADYFGRNTPYTNAIPNYNNKVASSRYKILKKGTIYMRASMASVTEIRDWSINYMPKTPVKVGYTLGNVGTSADIDSNNIYLLMYTDCAVTGANGIYSFMEGNVYYHDA